MNIFESEYSSNIYWLQALEARMRAVLICLLLFVSSVGPASAVSAKRAEAEFELCAYAAASIYEVGRSRTGLRLDDIQSDVAIPACQAAMESNPDSIEVKAWLAHGYYASGRW